MDNSLYWLIDSLRALPLALWIYIALGIPWALVVLPRRDWHMRGVVAALGFALGPAALTLWLFVLGTLASETGSPLLRADLSLIGAAAFTMMGIVLAFTKFRRTAAPSQDTRPLYRDEKLLIGLIVVAVILRWVVTAFWTFTAYDPLWVFGFEGRLYTLTNSIPQSIDYYPQFVPLQYTFAQLVAGEINDYFARVFIPMMHIGSILAAFSLGRLLFNRRTGLILAALWALYPHVSEWARIGDLEIPLAFLFTLSAAFFLRAWFGDSAIHRRRNALIAGLAFGVAMWTKPTAGAFVYGVVLLVVAELIRTRFQLRVWLPRFMVAFWTGLACIPIGALWYLRNIAYGHNAVDFPHPFWLTQATRSGDLFGWLILALVLLLSWAFVALERKPDWRWILPGVILVSVGLLPSMPWLNAARINPPDSYVRPLEWLCIAAGICLIAYALYQRTRDRLTTQARQRVTIIGGALMLALPYFVTWFVSYSYHARLSFAIVPLLILPSAVILAHWFSSDTLQTKSTVLRFAFATGIIALSVPGLLGTYLVAAPERDWLFSNRYPNDIEKYRLNNPGVVLTYEYLSGWIEAYDAQPVLYAPGEQRLPFFFPLLDIHADELPVRLDDIDDATHYLYGGQARRRYDDAGIPDAQNQIINSLARQDIMHQDFRFTDGTFRYELYEVFPERRWQPSDEINRLDDTVVFGDAVRYVGDSVSTSQLIGNTLYVNMQFEVLAELNADYVITLRLINTDDGEVYVTWEGYIAEGEHGHYATTLWQPGEFVFDQWRRQLEHTPDIPTGQNYEIHIGFKHPETGDYLPVTVNGAPAGDGYPLNSPFQVGG